MCNDDNHEFVGMDMCIYCHEPKQLLLQTQFFKDASGKMKPKKGIRKYQSTSPEPCDNCKKKFEEDGVVPMIEATPGPKGEPIFGKRYIFMKREAIQGQEFIDFMNKHGYLICEPDFIDSLLSKQKEQMIV